MPESMRKSRTKTKAKTDAVLEAAEELARGAAEDVAPAGTVGEHLDAKLVGERLLVHTFACLHPGYVGWRWSVSVARAPRTRRATVCEVDLLPGEGALLAPPWVPWDQRLRPEDVSRDDVLPYVADDDRLEPAFPAGKPEDADVLGVEDAAHGRARVLSAKGRAEAAERWYHAAHGPLPHKRPRATCSTCGFLVKLDGSLRTMFGVCANQWSPDDGQVVSLDHACGAHSETDVPRGADLPMLHFAVDEDRLEFESLRD